jgi:cytochrome P450 PksS
MTRSSRGARDHDRDTQFDILSPRFHADPFPTLDRMRAEAPVVRMKLPIVGRTWLAVTHDACATLLKDHETFARDPANAGIRTQARILKFLPRTIGLLALNMLGHDDPEHRRLRGLVDQAFQRRTIQAMKPTIAAIADRLLDRLEGRDQADLMAEFCRDLPLAVICEMLGLPAQDHARFKSWLGGLKDTANIGAVIRAVPGVISVVRYLRRVSRPGGGALPDGLVAALRDVETDSGRLSEDELVSMIFLLFGAGQETTTHLISGGSFALLSHEDQIGRLRSDPSLMPTCVEECLRHVSPVQMTKPRFAIRDGDLHGQPFRRGDMFAALLARRTAIPPSSRLRTGSTSRATRTRTFPSGRVCTSASGSSLPGPRPRSHSSASSCASQPCVFGPTRARSCGTSPRYRALASLP